MLLWPLALKHWLISSFAGDTRSRLIYLYPGHEEWKMPVCDLFWRWLLHSSYHNDLTGLGHGPKSCWSRSGEDQIMQQNLSAYLHIDMDMDGQAHTHTQSPSPQLPILSWYPYLSFSSSPPPPPHQLATYFSHHPVPFLSTLPSSPTTPISESPISLLSPLFHLPPISIPLALLFITPLLSFSPPAFVTVSVIRPLPPQMLPNPPSIVFLLKKTTAFHVSCVYILSLSLTQHTQTDIITACTHPYGHTHLILGTPSASHTPLLPWYPYLKPSFSFCLCDPYPECFPHFPSLTHSPLHTQKGDRENERTKNTSLPTHLPIFLAQLSIDLPWHTIWGFRQARS